MTLTPPTLEYQRLERARKTAIGGLRLLGILTATISIFLFSSFLYQRSGPGLSLNRYVLIDLAILGSVFLLGMAMFVCSLFIARRSRAAAVIALTIVCLESAGVMFLLYRAIRMILDDGGFFEPLYRRAAPAFLVSLVLLGWLAVAYEILHVLRHEHRID